MGSVYTKGNYPPDWGIICPVCRSKVNGVVDSRETLGGNRRHRKCECGNRYQTMEIIVPKGARFTSQTRFSEIVSAAISEPWQKKYRQLKERIAAALVDPPVEENDDDDSDPTPRRGQLEPPPPGDRDEGDGQASRRHDQGNDHQDEG